MAAKQKAQGGGPQAFEKNADSDLLLTHPSAVKPGRVSRRWAFLRSNCCLAAFRLKGWLKVWLVTLHLWGVLPRWLVQRLFTWLNLAHV